jgi:uncharacterized damage-inducible protein DinB
MIQHLQKQYALVQRTRAIVFDFLSGPIAKELNTPVPAFDNKTISDLLEHTAFCYYNWLACFAMQKPPLADQSDSTLDHIQRLYSRVDDTVTIFLRAFHEKMEGPITGTHDSMGQLSATPLELFTHVLTHEFHHKGQVMVMCRLLGHPPPDTDVSNFFNPEPVGQKDGESPGE